MKRAAAVLLLLALAAGLLSGCAAILEREVYEANPHTARQPELKPAEGNEINNYYKLKNTLLSLIAQATETENLRLTDYAGDVEEDLRSITSEIIEDTPIGAYAVSSIVFDYTKLITYHDLSVSIQYKKTAEQIGSMTAIINSYDFDRQISDALAQKKEFLLLKINTYYESTYNMDRIMRAMHSEPDTVLGLSSVEMAVFPDNGYQRLMEINISYFESGEETAEKAEKTREKLNELAEMFAGETERDTVENIYRWLSDHVKYDRNAASKESAERGWQPKNDSHTAYGALCEQKAGTEGFALTFLSLCRRSGIESLVVSGVQDDRYGFWNMVHLENKWYYVDCAAAAREGKDEYFLLTEKQAAEKQYKPDDGFPHAADTPFGTQAE